ncbi:MAG: hypothetical protein MK003_11085, partial [Pseudomonadales bacterium]|nr:hypothetical protein [Pseudomonadales bacterium]
MKRLLFVYLLLALVLGCAPEAEKELSAGSSEWRHHGGNHASDKYAPLDQIGASNFSDLEIAWRWQSADLNLPEDLTYPTGDFRAVPLVIGGTMYVITNHGQVAALNPSTGEQLWV